MMFACLLSTLGSYWAFAISVAIARLASKYKDMVTGRKQCLGKA